MLHFPILVKNFCLTLSLLLNSITIYYTAKLCAWLSGITCSYWQLESKALRFATMVKLDYEDFIHQRNKLRECF